MRIYLVPFCIMAESRSQLAPLGRRPHATNHPQQKWFAIQKLLQAEGTVSAQALMQERFGVTCAWGTAVRSWCRHRVRRQERSLRWQIFILCMFPTTAVTTYHKLALICSSNLLFLVFCLVVLSIMRVEYWSLQLLEQNYFSLQFCEFLLHIVWWCVITW